MATKKKQNTSHSESIDTLLKDLQDKFGEGAIMRLGGVKKADIGAISTHSPSLDIALGIGGIPRGRVTEIYGAESSGKTTLSLHIIAEAQKKGGRVAFIDAEHALDPVYAKKIGVRTTDLLISQPDSGEQALNIVESLVRSKAVDVIVIDSVAALTPQAEIEGEMGDQTIGLQARLMSRALRKLTAIVSQTNTAVIFINQTRMKIGGMRFGNPITTPGGKALKFYSSVRIELRRIAKIKKGDEIIGSRIRAKVVKNKVAPPFREAEFDIIYGKGISWSGDLLNIAFKKEIVKRKNTTYFFGEVKLGAGFENARQFLDENQSIAKQILAKTLKQE